MHGPLNVKFVTLAQLWLSHTDSYWSPFYLVSINKFKPTEGKKNNLQRMSLWICVSAALGVL